jgi:hypothetical protein
MAHHHPAVGGQQVLHFSVRRSRPASLGLDLCNPERVFNSTRLAELQEDVDSIKESRVDAASVKL